MFAIRRWAKALAVFFAFALGALAANAASAAMYLDTSVKDLKPEERVVVAEPKPVQILFQFKTKGSPNARATNFLKKKVLETVKASGLFSDVVEGPAPNGAVLSVTLDNVPITQDAAAQGFVTGLTFGLKGSEVTDGYDCTVEYLAGPDAAKLTRTGKHAIHTTIGLASPPADGVKAANPKEAVETMTRQVVDKTLNDLAADPAFGGKAPVLAAASAAVPAAAPAADAAAAAAPAPAAAPAATPASTVTPAPAPAAPAAAATPATAPQTPGER